MAQANHKSSTPEDPIYLAIERHKNAVRLWAAAVKPFDPETDAL